MQNLEQSIKEICTHTCIFCVIRFSSDQSEIFRKKISVVFSTTSDHFQLHVIQKQKQIQVGPFTPALVFLTLSMLKLDPVIFFFHKMHFLFELEKPISSKYLCYFICEQRFKCLKVFKKNYYFTFKGQILNVSVSTSSFAFLLEFLDVSCKPVQTIA